MMRNLTKRNKELERTEYKRTIWSMLCLGVIINMQMLYLYDIMPISDGLAILLGFSAIAYLYLLKRNKFSIGISGCIFVFLAFGILLGAIVFKSVKQLEVSQEKMTILLAIMLVINLIAITEIIWLHNFFALCMYLLSAVLIVINLRLWTIVAYFAIVWFIKLEREYNIKNECINKNGAYELATNLYIKLSVLNTFILLALIL